VVTIPGIILAFISAVGSFFIPESLKFLLKTKKYKQSQLVIEKIAKWNIHEYFFD
jgi:hypothetical protein